MEPVDLCCESLPRTDAVGGPGPCGYDGVVGQCDRIDNGRLNAALRAIGKINLRWMKFGHHCGLRKQVLVNSWMKDTISAIDSTGYGQDGELKDSVDQDTERIAGPAHQLILD